MWRYLNAGRPSSFPSRSSRSEAVEGPAESRLGLREMLLVALQASELVQGVDEPDLGLPVLGVGLDQLLEEPLGLLEQRPRLGDSRRSSSKIAESISARARWIL